MAFQLCLWKCSISCAFI